MKSLRYYDFGPFRLSVSDRLLMQNGSVVSLTPKLVDMLVVLVENRGHVLTKNALMETLWPDSFVEESSLTQNISLLRKALAASGPSEQYIETIPKRGYRFVAAVQEVIAGQGGNGTNGDLLVQERLSTQLLIEEQILESANEPVGPASDRIVSYVPVQRRRRKVLAVATALSGAVLFVAIAYFWSRPASTDGAPAVPNSIAVLPFNTIGSQSEPDLLGLGMADAIIIRLNHVNATTVLPTSSIHRYTSRDKDVISIGRDLGVDAVLDGTVQRDGARVRVSTALVRLSDGKTIWSQTFDSAYTSAFALQDSVSEKVVTALAPSVKPPIKTGMTENAEAYQAYLTGLYFWNLRSRENLPKAISYLEEAVRRDEQFALGHALLADAYHLSYREPFRLASSNDALARANASVKRALELDDSISEAHTVKAGIAFVYGRYDEARAEFQRALQLNPNYAPAHLRYAYFLLQVDFNLEQAVTEMRRATELDPVSPVNRTAFAYVLSMARDFDGAVRENKKAIELQPDGVVARLNLAENYTLKRMFKEAELQLDEVAKTEQLVAITQLRAYLYATSGRREQALRLLSELKRASGDDRLIPYEEAVLYAALGDHDSAFKLLRRTSPTRMIISHLRFDVRLDSLRSDKRFAEILNRPPI